MLLVQIGRETPLKRVEGGAGLRRRAAMFIGLLALVWLLLYTANALLPAVQSGAMAIYAAKFDRLAKLHMFGPADRTRVMVFGNSKVISGLHPARFDQVFGDTIRTYNLGLPAEERFLPILEATLAAGNIPTHVLLTFPWDGNVEPPSPLALLQDDNKLVNALLPFRSFPRDLALFAYNNRRDLAGGFRYAEGQIDRMIEDRGWYFIRGQSHFPNDRLPDGFEIPTDRPNRISTRVWPERSLVRDRLMQLARQHGFQIVLIPSYHRNGEFAAAPSADADRDQIVSESPPVRLIGPDYWSYPAAHFADPIHLNPAGSAAYTADLAALLQRHRVF